MPLDRLPTEHLRVLQPLLETHAHPAGAVVIQEGEAAPGLLLLDEGLLSVRTGPELELSRVFPGDAVGEVALLDGGPASATVVALQPVKLRLLRPEALAEYARRDPKGARLLVRLLSVRLAARLREVTGKVLTWSGERPSLQPPPPRARSWFQRLFGAGEAP